MHKEKEKACLSFEYPHKQCFGRKMPHYYVHQPTACIAIYIIHCQHNKLCKNSLFSGATLSRLYNIHWDYALILLKTLIHLHTYRFILDSFRFYKALYLLASFWWNGKLYAFLVYSVHFAVNFSYHVFVVQGLLILHELVFGPPSSNQTGKQTIIRVHFFSQVKS